MTLPRAVKNEVITMDKSYYFKNLMIGLFLFSICVYVSRSDDNALIYSGVSGVNALLFPFAKRLIENVVFRYSSKSFWESGPLSSAASNGGYTLLYVFYFMFAMPLALIFLIGMYIKSTR